MRKLLRDLPDGKAPRGLQQKLKVMKQTSKDTMLELLNIFLHPLNALWALMIVVVFCVQVAPGLPQKFTGSWLHAILEDCTLGEQSILVESCICLIDRIQSTLSKQMLQGIKKGWDALSDRNPDFPHVSLVSSMETCNVCNSALVLETARGRESSDAMLYSSQKGPQRLRWFKKVCRKCKRVFYDGWWSNAKSTRGVRGSLIQDAAEPQTGEEVFTSTKYTSFDVAYLVECDQQFLYNSVSFNGLANAYNGKHRALLVADGRQPYVGYLDSDAGRWLDDERLGDAWFKWTLGKFLRQYDLLEQYDLSVSGGSLDALLLHILPHYETLFEKTFASHECDVFGCTDCWVIDGHLKNRRFICATKLTNFVKVEGFPNGGFFEGCKQKPAPENLFCSDCLKHTMEGGPVSGKLDLKNKNV